MEKLKKIYKIGIILIGKNEAFTLEKVLNQCLKLNKKINVALLYIDSSSEDDSINIAKKFKRNNTELNFEIYKIKGKTNASIARNTGIKKLKNDCDLIFFLDADIVFNTRFVLEAVDLFKDKNFYGTVTGALEETYIDNKKSNIHLRFPKSLIKNGYLFHHGGNFITTKHLIDSVGMFDERLSQHEDFDFCIKVRKLGGKIYLVKEKLGTHYTISYNSPDRIISDVKNGMGKSSGIIIKKYIFSKELFNVLKVTKYFTFKLIILLFLAFSLIDQDIYLICIAIFFVFLIIFRKTKNTNQNITSKIISFGCAINLLVGFFSRDKDIEYKVTQIDN